ncbi:hypothetical protein F0169_18265 [Pseudomonas sp. MAFF 212408]|uniref:Uncharacterized protein n=1 Tax=Pseudomonas kitaguniensis TaxID=2607908 RepID=A0A5N7KNS7_9PSED|nr:hypothetical protein [Pseudomonas kitaguniensis]
MSVFSGWAQQYFILAVCGSGLARECRVSVNRSVTDPPLSRASPLPHGICVSLHMQRVAQSP